MLHVIELAVVLLLLAVGHGAVNVQPNAVRRIVCGYFVWLLAFAIGIFLVSIASLTTWLVRIGIVLIVAYTLRWFVAEVGGFFRGPFLLAVSGTAALAEAARSVSGLPVGECRRMARRISRNHAGSVALLGLAQVGQVQGRNETEFGDAWAEACEAALKSVCNLVRRHSPRHREGRISANDVRFIAQALCLYEPASLERVLGRLPSPPLGGRAARVRAARQLEKFGTRTMVTERLSIEAPPGRAAEDTAYGGFKMWMVVLPSLGLARSGHPRRATAQAISFGLLLGYAIAALLMDRSSGWVFLSVAALIHVEAVFALGDFCPPAVPGKADPTVGGRAT